MPDDRSIVAEFINLTGTTGSHSIQRREKVRVRTVIIQVTLDNDSATVISLRDLGFKDIQVLSVDVLTSDSDATGRWIVTERFRADATTDELSVYWQDNTSSSDKDSVNFALVGTEIRNLPARVVIQYVEKL